ncbi:hypothetical protein RND71_031209 [Anisodus tanguticus]|uniref:Uncharacterized protein n=1 Tax=Anisodus tanguticus TaxID=243964 RepID=A0AAE1RBY2_9SOLA|nr:hypothetical protein RND71_031209 [Anisodus tanguticus]
MNDTANSTDGTNNSFTVAIHAPNFITYNISFQDSEHPYLRVDKQLYKKA